MTRHREKLQAQPTSPPRTLLSTRGAPGALPASLLWQQFQAWCGAYANLAGTLTPAQFNAGAHDLAGPGVGLESLLEAFGNYQLPGRPGRTPFPDPGSAFPLPDQGARVAGLDAGVEPVRHRPARWISRMTPSVHPRLAGSHPGSGQTRPVGTERPGYASQRNSADRLPGCRPCLS